MQLTWKDEPAIEKQLKYIEEMQEYSVYQLPKFTGKTKGEASEYISRYNDMAHEYGWAIEHGY